MHNSGLRFDDSCLLEAWCSAQSDLTRLRNKLEMDQDKKIRVASTYPPELAKELGLEHGHYKAGDDHFWTTPQGFDAYVEKNE